MRKTLFSKYFYICSSIILISTAFLGVVLLVFSVQYFRDDQYTLLERNVKQSVVLTNLNYSANGYKYVDPAYLQPFYQLQGQAIDADIFLVDVEGKTLLCSNTTSCTHVDYLLPSAVMERLKTAGDYRETGKLGGIYKTSYYTVVGSDGQTVGAVFASTSSAALTTFLVDIFQMYVISAALVMLFAFIVIYFVTSNMVRPLQDMLAATRSFSKGDFSIRVLVEGDDEVAMLAAAFNSMASSLAVMESTRRSFTANVSHELKTPMTTIAGYADGILDGVISRSEERQYLAIISDESRRLSRLVRRMLDVSQLQSLDLIREKAPFDLSESMRRVLVSMEKKITGRGLDVDVDIPEDPVIVLGDNDLLTQVVYNLLENAAKFAAQGSTLFLGLEKRGEKAVVTVRNQGDPIPPEELPLLFERFHKSDKSRSQDKDGVGLGLYIVRTILEQHREKITAASTDGLTTFSFTVQLAGEEKSLASGK